MGRLNASAHGALAVVTLKVFASAGGAVNGPDIRGLAAALLSDRTPSAGYCAFDLTGDGQVTMDDVAPFVAMLIP